MKKTILSLAVVTTVALTMTGCVGSQPKIQKQPQYIALTKTKPSVTIMATKEVIEKLMENASKYKETTKRDYKDGYRIDKEKYFSVSLGDMIYKHSATAYYCHFYNYDGHGQKASQASMTTFDMKVKSKKITDKVYQYTFYYPTTKYIQVEVDIFGNIIEQVDSQKNMQADFDNVYDALIKNATAITAETESKIPAYVFKNILEKEKQKKKAAIEKQKIIEKLKKEGI